MKLRGEHLNTQGGNVFLSSPTLSRDFKIKKQVENIDTRTTEVKQKENDLSKINSEIYSKTSELNRLEKN